MILPTSENTFVPGLASLPIAVNHAGPLAMIGRDVEPGLDVVDVGRIAPTGPFWAGYGGRGRERPDVALPAS